MEALTSHLSTTDSTIDQYTAHLDDSYFRASFSADQQLVAATRPETQLQLSVQASNPRCE